MLLHCARWTRSGNEPESERASVKGEQGLCHTVGHVAFAAVQGQPLTSERDLVVERLVELAAAGATTTAAAT